MIEPRTVTAVDAVVRKGTAGSRGVQNSRRAAVGDAGGPNFGALAAAADAADIV